MSDPANLIHDVVAAPLGDVIASVGAGVAAAQHALDEASLSAVLSLYTESDDELITLLQAIGYRPTFYALPETTGEMRVSLKLGNGSAGTAGRGVRPMVTATTPQASIIPARSGLNLLPAKLYATPVDAGYANQYGYTADVSATLTFKIVPIPAPQGADELRRVPDVIGRPTSAARMALEALGFTVRLVVPDGATPDPTREMTVVDQDPSKKTIRSIGDEVILTVEVDA